MDRKTFPQLRGSVFALIFLLAVSLIIFNYKAVPVTAQDQKISIYIEGVKLVVDVPPFIRDGRTLVPMRAIFEALGAKVDWDGATRTVFASRDQDFIKLQIDNKDAEVNGRRVTLDVAATIREDRTMVPLRFVGESLGANVHWNEADRSVAINFPGRPSIRFHGKVELEDGSAAGGIPLELTAADFTGKVLSDNRGAFSFRTFSTGESKWWLSPKSPDHVYYRYLIQGAKTGSSYELDFVLYHADAFVTGTVKDASGNVFAGSTVVAYNEASGFGSHTTSDSSGSYSLPVSTSKGSSWQLELQPGTESFYQKENISVQEGRELKHSLEAAPADARLQGYLKDNRDNPLAGIYVKGESSKGYGISYTDNEGYFDIPVASSLSNDWKVTAHLPSGPQTREVSIRGEGNYQVRW